MAASTPEIDDIYAQIKRLESMKLGNEYAAAPSTLAPSSAAYSYTFTTLPDGTAPASSSTSASGITPSPPTSSVQPYTQYRSLDEETALLDAFSVLSLTDAENKQLDDRIFEASLIIPRMVFDSLLQEIAADYMAEFRKKKYPITDPERAELDRLFNDRKGQLVIDAFSIEMTTTLLQCLKPSQWLNDEVHHSLVACV